MINIQASDLELGMEVYIPKHGYLTVRGKSSCKGCKEMYVMFREYPYHLSLQKDVHVQVKEEGERRFWA